MLDVVSHDHLEIALLNDDPDAFKVLYPRIVAAKGPDRANKEVAAKIVGMHAHRVLTDFIEVSTAMEAYIQTINPMLAAVELEIDELLPKLIDRWWMIQYSTGDAVVHGLAAHGADDAFESLINEHMSECYRPGYNGMRPIHWACRKGHMGILKMILDQFPMEIESEDKDGNRPIHHACLASDSTILEYLVSTFPDEVLKFNNAGETAVSITQKLGRFALTNFSPLIPFMPDYLGNTDMFPSAHPQIKC